jgi:hypothetical protein
MIRKILPLLLVLTGFMLASCKDYGKVEQGRTVAFDADKSVVTIIVDNNIDPKKQPNYMTLPTHDYALPTDKMDRGADPTPGLRINLDVDGKTITMYNPATKDFEKLSIEVVKDDKNIELQRRHPLVWDASTRKAIKFPQVNAENKTIVIYSQRQSRVTTIKLSDADFAKYKTDDWAAGDEVRIYYREQGKSLRFMNITKTDISRR